MATPRLITSLALIARRYASPVERGLVTEMTDTSLTVMVGGETAQSSQATDEPMRTGRVVWTQRAQGGARIVLGSA